MGMFFFCIAYFGFTSLSVISLFHEERLIFLRERAGGYYNTFPYYCAKIVADVIPLRVLPPMLFSVIVYWSAGHLQPYMSNFWIFTGAMVLVNLCATGLNTIISSFCNTQGLANFVASFVLMVWLLIGSYMVNKETLAASPLTGYIRWICYAYYAFEAILVNECSNFRYSFFVQLPADTPLKLAATCRTGREFLIAFGFVPDNQDHDMMCLAVMAVATYAIAYMQLRFLIVEVR